MYNLKAVRENPESFNNGMKLRGMTVKASELLALEDEVNAKLGHLQTLQAKRNNLAKDIAQYKAKGLDANSLMQEGEKIKTQIPLLEAEVDDAKAKLHKILVTLPNIPAEDVPFGESEEDNTEIRNVGKRRDFDFPVKQHFELGEDLGQMNFEAAAKISGSRFVILKSDLARLERALVNFMLDINTMEYGYTELSVPSLVNESALFNVGQLPKFEDQSFVTRENFRLIPTSEVVLTNLRADEIMHETELPLRYTAHTPCYRSEAGSAGRDTRGMIRMHQFNKVELVSIVRPQDSKKEHERMLSCAEEILKRLELPYRVMLLCSQDMSFAAVKTYDIEVWLPGQNKYREISSCSNCGDFQSRRMKSRYQDINTGHKIYPHTLNGSALPLGRTIVALLENYQNENGSIAIPEKLKQYMNNRDVIPHYDY